MSDAPQHPLYAATKRLVDALNRLERNLQQVQQSRDGQQQLIVFEQENEGLRQERKNLNAAISQLQNQYSDLHEVAYTIYGKLDDSIRQLTQIIEQ